MKRILIIGLFAFSVALDVNAAILPVVPQIEILDEASSFIESILCNLHLSVSTEINMLSTYVDTLDSDYSKPSFSVRMKGAVFLREIGGYSANYEVSYGMGDTLKLRRARDGLTRN